MTSRLFWLSFPGFSIVFRLGSKVQAFTVPLVCLAILAATFQLSVDLNDPDDLLDDL
jgi:hypothetical protein